MGLVGAGASFTRRLKGESSSQSSRGSRGLLNCYLLLFSPSLEGTEKPNKYRNPVNPVNDVNYDEPQECACWSLVRESRRKKSTLRTIVGSNRQASRSRLGTDD